MFASPLTLIWSPSSKYSDFERMSNDDLAGTVTVLAIAYVALPRPVLVFCAPNLNNSTDTLPELAPSTFDTIRVLILK